MTKHTIKFTINGVETETSRFADWDEAYAFGMSLAKMGADDVEMYDYCTHDGFGCAIRVGDDQMPANFDGSKT